MYIFLSSPIPREGLYERNKCSVLFCSVLFCSVLFCSVLYTVIHMIKQEYGLNALLYIGSSNSMASIHCYT